MRTCLHCANPNRWRRLARGIVLCGLLVFAAWSTPEARAQARLCPNTRLLVGGGSSDLLGIFGELGLRCTPAPSWSLVTGLRYTEQRANVQPFAVLAYETPLALGWRVRLTTSVRERAGDYEIDRLPELYLWWYPPTGPSFLVPSLQLFVGSIATFRPQAQTTRAGGILVLGVRPLRLGANTELTPGLQLGGIAYGTGQNHSYWMGTVNLVIRPTSRTEVGFSYLRQEGFGVSPLAFDQVNLDHLFTARIGGALTRTDWVFVAATFTLVTQPATIKEYVLSWARAGAWTASVTFRQTDGKVFFGLTLP